MAKHGYKARRRTYAPGPRRWERRPEPERPVAAAPAPAPDAAEEPAEQAEGGTEAATTKKKWWQFWK